MGIWPFARHKSDESERLSQLPLIEKFGENLTPNMRALRLSMTMADQLLSMGVSANSVVSKVLDVTETYCKRPVHIDISSNVVMLSQLRGIEREPLTLIRPVTLRDTNYRTIQAIQRLIYEIRQGNHTLTNAEEMLKHILEQPKQYPWWVITFANASLVAGVTLMYTTSLRAIVTTFCIGILIDRLLALLTRYGIPAFFRQVVAAMTITLVAAAIHAAGKAGMTFFADINPTLLVVGGVVMLVAGLVIVGAIQDAIEEYYVSANARLTKVIMLTVGIVVGILIALYTARKLGIGIAVSPDPLVANVLYYQVLGAVIASAGYSLARHTRLLAVIGVGAVGGIGVAVVSYVTNFFDISAIPAAGLAAATIGLAAAFISRFWHTPSVGVISGAIVPLVPGLMLYSGLMQLINYPPSDPLFSKALGTLFAAVAVALTIAAGASLGGMIGRPLHQKLAYTRNATPFVDFMRRQLTSRRKSPLGFFALGRFKPQHDNTITEVDDDTPHKLDTR